LIDI